MRALVLFAVLLAGCKTVTELDQHGTGIGVGGEGLSVVSMDTPAVFAVVFECQHGKFIVQGSDERHRALWRKLKRGQAVLVNSLELRREDGTIAGYKFRGAEVVR